MNIDPAKIQVAKDIFSNYTENNNLVKFSIIHIYPNYNTKLNDNNCFYDSLQFKAVIYNTETVKKRLLSNSHDQLHLVDFYTSMALPVKMLRIFADGSTLVQFNTVVKLIGTAPWQIIMLTTENV